MHAHIGFISSLMWLIILGSAVLAIRLLRGRFMNPPNLFDFVVFVYAISMLVVSRFIFVFVAIYSYEFKDTCHDFRKSVIVCAFTYTFSQHFIASCFALRLFGEPKKHEGPDMATLPTMPIL
jgi:hypothetical protein